MHYSLANFLFEYKWSYHWSTLVVRVRFNWRCFAMETSHYMLSELQSTFYCCCCCYCCMPQTGTLHATHTQRHTDAVAGLTGVCQYVATTRHRHWRRVAQCLVSSRLVSSGLDSIRQLPACLACLGESTLNSSFKWCRSHWQHLAQHQLKLQQHEAERVAGRTCQAKLIASLVVFLHWPHVAATRGSKAKQFASTSSSSFLHFRQRLTNFQMPLRRRCMQHRRHRAHATGQTGGGLPKTGPGLTARLAAAAV